MGGQQIENTEFPKWEWRSRNGKGAGFPCERKPDLVNDGAVDQDVHSPRLELSAGMLPTMPQSINRALATVLLILLSASVAGARRNYLEAQFLDYSESSPCHYDCQPFDRVFFNFCFQIHGQVLTGQTWAWKWEYDPGEMAPLKGKTVQIRYDKSHVWVVRTDGKELRLTRAKAKFENHVCN